MIYTGYRDDVSVLGSTQNYKIVYKNWSKGKYFLGKCSPRLKSLEFMALVSSKANCEIGWSSKIDLTRENDLRMSSNDFIIFIFYKVLL